ncbi:MAG: hypothetical protein COU85_02500 [Candidatus Portnoybacteria bacterium CG10_big_fil_rev_8_21_14_0_10_44_7]|uniref:Uncharacterized protein n=1 Tax=Candidatus Portnoybacteria bacterium CG10_big_fil_rev_8_21_14_0_10_44_7 TaxID=1974816 RepID=A0A2M8KIB4_9BACT|nr:MAG: hypothetical protein COU85_02500 [Candidatus Portnoybacteria bacterium CG10_big_fil_rev_8_21_14_0_10_44_7]
MQAYLDKISKLLRTESTILQTLEQKMNKATGKKGILEGLVQKNDQLVTAKNQKLGLGNPNAQKVYLALLDKVKTTDALLYDFFGQPKFNDAFGCTAFTKTVAGVAGQKTGFFLREQKLKDFLVLNPPKNIIRALGHQNVRAMLEKEDVYEIFAGLRFAEDGHWLNDVFFRPYLDLRPEHFERREIKIKMLDAKWLEIGRGFVAKKLHHISHLKEVGLVFVIPTEKENAPGQSLEVLTLILHYFHEIDFYAKIFAGYQKSPDFAQKVVRALQGEVSGQTLAGNGPAWRIVQRYLAKNDKNDPRLFEPHINPEALHWLKAERDLLKLDEQKPEFDFTFWQGLDWMGELLWAGKKGDELVSYDLIDNIIALTRGGLMKYLYHQQEALWNKIFTEYLGLEKMEELLVQNLDKGIIRL